MVSRSLGRRVNKELVQINEYYADLDFHCLEKHNKYDNPIKIIIEDKNKIEIFIFNSYPFKSPKLYIEGKIHMDNLCIYSRLLSNIFNKKIKCLCCSSLLCNDNWKPSKRLLDILKEYFRFNKMIQTVYKNYINKICIQYTLPTKINELIFLYI